MPVGIPRMACCQINAKCAFWHLAGVNLRIYPLVGGKPCPPDFLLVGATPGRDIVIHANPRFKKSKKRANIIDAFGVDSPRTALL